jgi:hypothetical protein
MIKISFEGDRCPDGVEMVAAENDTQFRFRTSKRVQVRIEHENLSSPVVVAFANANSDPELQVFLSRYGMLTALDKDMSFVSRRVTLTNQKFLRSLLIAAGGANVANAIDTINHQIPAELSPRITFGENQRPVLSLTAPDLFNLMLLECVAVVEHGAKYAECEKCKKSFLTGPLTGRRATAKFCSDRCRVAAMRARQLAKEL